MFHVTTDLVISRVRYIKRFHKGLLRLNLRELGEFSSIYPLDISRGHIFGGSYYRAYTVNEYITHTTIDP